MKVRLGVACLALVSAVAVASAEGGAAVPLPKPRTRGTVSVEAALQQRRSLRAPAQTPLTLAEVGQLCWAAQGVTDDHGHRTAPSAHAAYPLAVYLLSGEVRDLPPGLYRYLPATHALEPVRAGDLRHDFEQRGVGQGWIAKAPALFVITGTLARMGSMGDRGAQFMAVEAGLAAQGLFLQAEALGLGGTYVGGFRPRESREVLGLPEGEEVLGVLPVGHRP
ncbi:MAG TPA: SagB/ThcOx family dehydrogenase [Anaeromyxobacter sp.]|nr:SagB/ThcOx family dehydrogenase [Anaeromyxobacter sp.]